MTLAAIFYNPIQLNYYHLLWLVVPLSISVAVIYRTLRTNNIRRLPLQVVSLVGMILVGLVALAAGLWFIQGYCL